MNQSSNSATLANRCARRWLVFAVAVLAGCGSAGGGTPSTDIVCTGDGVVVSGKVTFVKRLYDKQGLTGVRIVKPVRRALVEIVLDIDGRAIASTSTDANGNYCVRVRGVPPDFPTVYPRVATRTDPNDRINNPRGFNITVVNDIQSSPSSLYSWAGTEFNGTSTGIYDRDIAIPVTAQLSGQVDFPLAGAFNILDVALHGAEVATALAGRPPNAQLILGWTPGTVFGDGTVGTYFVGDDPRQIVAGIELSGGLGGGPDSGDHDEYDDDVILHEFGHFMAYSFSAEAEAGGAHYLNDNTQDIRLSWSEGWATFFSAAVRNSPVMVNTRGGDPGHPDRPFSYFFDIERPHSDLLSAPSIGTPLEDHGVYTTSEVAVASVLWDLFDSSNESGDSLALGFQGVWDVFERLALVQANVSLETFADYFSRQFGMLNLARAAALRRVQLTPDEYEDRDDLPTLSAPAVGSGQVTCHTLFPAGDVDYVQIPLPVDRAVTVETFNLSNGADTVVELLNAQGQVVSVNGVPLENDNALNPRGFELTACGNRRKPVPAVYFAEGINNGARFASSASTGIGNTLPAGMYYARITSKATSGQGRVVSAGELGSYDLIVTLD